MTRLVMCQTSQTEKAKRSLLQDGKQEDDMMMMTNRQPLIMMWSKMAPKGTKRAKVAATMMMRLAKSTGFN